MTDHTFNMTIMLVASVAFGVIFFLLGITLGTQWDGRKSDGITDQQVFQMMMKHGWPQ